MKVKNLKGITELLLKDGWIQKNYIFEKDTIDHEIQLNLCDNFVVVYTWNYFNSDRAGDSRRQVFSYEKFTNWYNREFKI